MSHLRCGCIQYTRRFLYVHHLLRTANQAFEVVILHAVFFWQIIAFSCHVIMIALPFIPSVVSRGSAATAVAVAVSVELKNNTFYGFKYFTHSIYDDT